MIRENDKVGTGIARRGHLPHGEEEDNQKAEPGRMVNRSKRKKTKEGKVAKGYASSSGTVADGD